MQPNRCPRKDSEVCLYRLYPRHVHPADVLQLFGKLVSKMVPCASPTFNLRLRVVAWLG